MKPVLINFKSGIVVFLVALPLCLGIALACKVPPLSGILAGIVGGLVVTLLSGSILSVSGPAAGLTSVILTSIATLGSFPLFLAAVICAGALQVVFGFIRAGSITNFVPVAVIKGMLAGIGIILIMKQLPHLVGYDGDPEGDFDFLQQDGHNTISDLYYMFQSVSPGAIAIGVFSVVLLVLGEKKSIRSSAFFRIIPVPLIVVVVSAGLNYFFTSSETFKISEEHMVTLPAITTISDLKNTLIAPDFSAIQTGQFWRIALTLALVASLESLLSIEASDRLDPLKRYSDGNKELRAQGAGNILCGLIGALPVTAVIVRSSANIGAGATTKLSSFIHGALLLLCVVLIPGLLMLIPNAALAAILIMTGYKLTQFDLFRQYFKKGIDQFLPFIVTIVMMLLTDLLKGVGAGVAVSIFFIIRNNINASFEVAEDTIEGRKNYLIKLPQHITFFNKGYIVKYLRRIKRESLVIIDGSINKSTDKDVKEILLDFVELSKKDNIEVQFVKYNID